MGPDDVNAVSPGVFRQPSGHDQRLQDAGARLNTIDGLRVDWADGFGLIRGSNTTPVLVLRFEGHTAEALHRIEAQFMAVLRSASSGSWFCGGSLVAPYYVMTANHCVRSSSGLRDPSTFVVLREEVAGQPAQPGLLVKLNHDSVVLRLLEQGNHQRLVWVDNTLEVLESQPVVLYVPSSNLLVLQM